MNTEIKNQWVKALRDPAYQQTYKKLKNYNGFDCLGVLCDLHAKEFNRSWEHLWLDIGPKNKYFNHLYDLPEEVRDWAGLDSMNPSLIVCGRKMTLVYINDDLKYSFKQIADLIEEQL